MIKKIIVFICLGISLLSAQNQAQIFFNLYIKDKPKGIARDFYIWQYLNENQLSSTEIHTAYNLLSNKNPYLRRVLKNLEKTITLPKDILCASMTAKQAINENEACIKLVTNNKLSSFKVLSNQETKKILNKITDPQLATTIKILLSPQREQLILNQNATIFTKVYQALNATEKQKIAPSFEVLQRLSKENYSPFFHIINSVALDAHQSAFKKALLANQFFDMPHNTLFLLGLNEVRFGSTTKALEYFKHIQQATKSQFFIDRALLWQYLITQDQQFLEMLTTSSHVNIFSIYASQQLNKKPAFNIQDKFSSLSAQNPPFDISNPYEWQQITATYINSKDPTMLTKAIPLLSYTKTSPHLSVLKQRLEDYAISYYLMPYGDSIIWDSQEQRSFVYAIAKQESQLIPSVISRSFALGLMQIMPAYIKTFAKEMGKSHITYQDLFNPTIALEMGRHYIKKLQKEYKHPLFVAYAYNGGPTFLRKLLAKNQLFIKNRSYEPWLSMELIPYEETRFYGMRVMANFIIYEQLRGHQIQIKDLLQETLVYPKK